MPTQTAPSQRAIREQLALLQAERRHYSTRVMAIAGDLERRHELEGYLKLIENINHACVRLASATGTPAASSFSIQLAA